MSRGSWLRVWLLGALGPMLVLMIAAVIAHDLHDAYDSAPDATILFSLGWLIQTLFICVHVALACLAIQLAIVGIMAVAERREAKPMPLWMFAGVIAGLPLVLYLLWPHMPRNPSIALMTFIPGIAGAAIGRRIRHGGEAG